MPKSAIATKIPKHSKKHQDYTKLVSASERRQVDDVSSSTHRQTTSTTRSAPLTWMFDKMIVPHFDSFSASNTREFRTKIRGET